MNEPRWPRALGSRDQFACCVEVEPIAVWAALTVADQTAQYLYGLAAHSSWEPNDVIEFRHGSLILHGRVIHADSAHRLSFSLAAGPHDPLTYVTWEISPRPDGSGGSSIRLQVDETDSCVPDQDEAVTQTWAAVLAALEVLLAR